MYRFQAAVMSSDGGGVCENRTNENSDPGPSTSEAPVIIQDAEGTDISDNYLLTLISTTSMAEHQLLVRQAGWCPVLDTTDKDRHILVTC